MSTEVGKAYVQIIPSAEGIKSKLAEIMGDNMPSGEESGQRFGQGLVSKIKSVIAAAGIGKALQSAISEGAAMEQSLGGIETLFKNSADTVIKNARQAYKTAGLSANEYMENVTSFSASLLQSLGGDTAKAASIADMAMVDMSDNANKMGTDMQDIRNAYQGFAKQNYTMLDNLKLGYGGTKEEMQRLLADAQQLTGVKYDINNLSDVYNAIHAIQENLDITGTTAEEAANTISGSFASMKAAFKNVLGSMTLGEDIMPSLQALASTIGTFVVGNLIPAIGNIGSALPTIINFAMSAGAEFINGLSQGFSENVSNFIAGALPMLVEFSAQLKANAGQLIDAGLNLVLQLAQGIADSLPVLIENIPTIVTNIAGIINENAPKLLITAGALLLTLGRGLIQAIPTLISHIPQIIQAIISVWTAFNWLNLGKTVVTHIKDGLKALPGQAKQLVTNAVNNIKGAFNNSGIENVVKTVINGAKNAISNGMNAAKSTVTNILNGIKSAFSDKLNAAKNIVKSVIDKIKGFFKFSWSLPKLKLPHIKYSIIDVPVLGKIPNPSTLRVEWYRKAMNNAMLLSNPTIFGYANGNFLGAGESGPEVVAGANTVQKMVQDAVDGVLSAKLDEVNDNFGKLFAIMGEYYPQFASMQPATVGDVDLELGRISERRRRWN